MTFKNYSYRYLKAKEPCFENIYEFSLNFDGIQRVPYYRIFYLEYIHENVGIPRHERNGKFFVSAMAQHWKRSCHFCVYEYWYEFISTRGMIRMINIWLSRCIRRRMDFYPKILHIFVIEPMFSKYCTWCGSKRKAKIWILENVYWGSMGIKIGLRFRELWLEAEISFKKILFFTLKSEKRTTSKF